MLLDLVFRFFAIGDAPSALVHEVVLDRTGRPNFLTCIIHSILRSSRYKTVIRLARMSRVSAPHGATNSPRFGNPPISFAAAQVEILIRRIGRRLAKLSIDQGEAVGPEFSIVSEPGPRDR